MIEFHPEFLTKDGKPQFAVLPYEEFLQLQEALRRPNGSAPEPDPRYGGFFDNLSAEELACRQGVGPVTDLSKLAWPYGAADWEGFEEAVDQWRSEHRTR
jgi:hypothetical protein